MKNNLENTVIILNHEEINDVSGGCACYCDGTDFGERMNYVTCLGICVMMDMQHSVQCT